VTVKLGTLMATGKPVEVTRFLSPPFGILLQFTAETGYVQVQLAELLRLLLGKPPAPPAPRSA
jgi:hypothetical protein